MTNGTIALIRMGLQFQGVYMIATITKIVKISVWQCLRSGNKIAPVKLVPVEMEMSHVILVMNLSLYCL